MEVSVKMILYFKPFYSTLVGKTSIEMADSFKEKRFTFVPHILDRTEEI